MKIKAYNQEIEAQMLNFYKSLSEKDRRRYAAIEAAKLGYGGDTYIRTILHCDNRTITRGKQELMTSLFDEGQRIRKPGGGRKYVIDEMKGLDEAFLNVLQNYTAGSPMDETIKWTNLTRHTIVEKLKEQGFIVSNTVIDPLLKKHGFRP